MTENQLRLALVFLLVGFILGYLTCLFVQKLFV